MSLENNTETQEVERRMAKTKNKYNNETVTENPNNPETLKNSKCKHQDHHLRPCAGAGERERRKANRIY